MFESLKTLWKKENQPPQDYDRTVPSAGGEIARLEGELQGNPANGECRKH
jgi:hypothetical protein